MSSSNRVQFRRRLGWFTAVFLLPLILSRPFLSQSLWVDEASSVWFARQPVTQILTALCDPHPPGYYLLLKLWLQAGQEELWLRLPSLLAAAVSAALLFRLGRQFLGDRLSWLAVLLLAWQPLQIWYAAETRMYLPVQAAGLAAFISGWLYLAPDTPPRRLRLWAFFYWLTAAIALILDFSALLPLGLLQLLWLAGGRPNKGSWLLLQSAVLLPPLILFSLSGQGPALTQTYQPIFLAVQAARLGLPITPGEAATVLRLVLAGIVAISLPAAWTWPRRRVHLASRGGQLAAVLFTMAWLALLLFSAVPRLFTIKRLLVVILPYLALTTAFAIRRWPRWIQFGIPLLGLLISFFILPGQQREPWRQVTADLQETITGEPGVVWVDELAVPAFAFYAGSEAADHWAPLFGRRLPALPGLQPEPGETLWLVTGNNPYRHLNRLLPADFYAEFEGGLIREEVGIRVYAYRRRMAEEADFTTVVKPPTQQEEWGLLLPSPLDTCGNKHKNNHRGTENTEKTSRLVAHHYD